MPTKTPAKKKNVKVTQLDPKAKGGAILDARKRAMEEERLRVMRIIEPLTLRVTALESNVLELFDRLPVPEPKEPEPWVPKVDGRVANIQAPEVWGYGTVEYLNPASPESAHKTAYVRWDNGRYGTHYFDQLRPVTQAEIDAHLEAEAIMKQEAEWAAITELQEGDACEVTPKQYDELRALLEPLYACYSAGNSYDEWVEWDPRNKHAPLQRWTRKPHGELRPVVIPFHELLRRAKGTAARLKAERKAEEAKPIPFGTRVKVKGAGSNGIYWYASGDKHKVVFDCGSFLVVPRNEITVIPTKP